MRGKFLAVKLYSKTRGTYRGEDKTYSQLHLQMAGLDFYTFVEAPVYEESR